MTGFPSVSEGQLDALREAGNIGAAHAATALSAMLGSRVDMSVPSVRIAGFEEVTGLFGEEEISCAVLLQLKGDVPGTMFFLLPLDEANELTSLLLGGAEVDLNQEPMPEMGASALNEAGNILSGSYLSALSDFTGLNLQPTPPAVACDMTMALLSYGLAEVSMYGDYALLIDTSISLKEKSDSLKGTFLLLPDPDGIQSLFEALGVSI
ncbi:chemotaxis protein CheC [Alkalicoccus urumqiensis]|uniref:CheY-P-specific phosphatase CheC n=1 Tax=Alkalicoccus urumqiensis TaxID=1548213 RepID=A0A2P6MFZ4_ALKUR|nr:chemotaxis protein CheC [Alkalicoccus urumqiensis]PRO65208.1 CheY-P-specific phosphatase CheC [Alkalicoccus urumqiensis]